MRIFLSAGEPSGDHHAADLVRALRERLPDAEFVGYGGPHLEAVGARVFFRLTDLAVMWFGRVLLNLHKFVKLARDAERYFRDEKPDAVVLVDFPGFHWALAKRARRQGIPVYYFVPPQLWAWAGWRVEKVRRWVDGLLCSLPFEPAWYAERGVSRATYVGHPFFDDVKGRKLDEAFLAAERARGGPVVAILPGSRTQELTRNLPAMLRAAAKVAGGRPGTRFVVACLHERHRRLAESIAAESGLAVPGLELFAGRTPELIRLADLAWSVSGSVSLELMMEALPTVILYTIRPLDLWVARPFIKAKYITLVNLLADAPLMPEYLTDRDASAELADWAGRWLGDESARASASRALAELRDRVAVPGAAERAADWIAGALAGRGGVPYRGPHERAAAVRDERTA
jgi:lipid-A-disaccharide synthase